MDTLSIARYMEVMGRCFFIFLFITITVFRLNSSFARPEYAARHRITSCTACHYSPAGGGLRTRYGKEYGAHNFKMSSFGQQDWVSADVRFMYVNPQQHQQARGGLAVMAGILGATAPITPEEQKSAIRLVYTHDIAGLAGALESYVRYRRFADPEVHWYPQYFLLGRFHAPFGLMTDEHRTYTKMQSLSDWNTRIEGGG